MFRNVHDNEINGLTLKLFKEVMEEKPGFQLLSSSLLIYLLSCLNSISVNRYLNGSDQFDIIHIAKRKYAENLYGHLSSEDLAYELGIGYSKFRKTFKQATGLSPGQYLLNLKILKAREIFKEENTSVKEVAYKLGFESDYYFNRLFKSKTGITPGKFKKMVRP